MTGKEIFANLKMFWKRAAISSVSDNLTKKNFKFLQESNNSENPMIWTQNPAIWNRLKSIILPKFLKKITGTSWKFHLDPWYWQKTLYKKNPWLRIGINHSQNIYFAEYSDDFLKTDKYRIFKLHSLSFIICLKHNSSFNSTLLM